MADEQSKPPCNKPMVHKGLEWASLLECDGKELDDATARFLMNGPLRTGQEVRDARVVTKNGVTKNGVDDRCWVSKFPKNVRS